MGLTPDLLLLALSCVLCGERMNEGLFIYLVHPQYPQTLMEFQPAPFRSHALFSTHHFRPPPPNLALIIQIVKPEN